MAVTNPYANILNEIEKQQEASSALAEQQRNEQLAYIQSQVDQAKVMNQQNLENAGQQSDLNYQLNYNSFPFMNTQYGVPAASVGALTSLTNAGQNSYSGLLNTQKQGDLSLGDISRDAIPYLDILLSQNRSDTLSQYGDARNSGLVGQAQFDLDEDSHGRAMKEYEREIAEILAKAAATNSRANSTPTQKLDISYLWNDGQNQSTDKERANALTDKDVQNYINGVLSHYTTEGTVGLTADPKTPSGGGSFVARESDRKNIYEDLMYEEAEGRLSASQVQYIANTVLPGGYNEYKSYWNNITKSNSLDNYTPYWENRR